MIFLFTKRILFTTYVILLAACLPESTYATDTNNQESSTPFGRMQSHEPSTLGFSYDNNDVNYMDFKLSFKYPMFHKGVVRPPKFSFLPYPYLAFTGRFSQYINTRESSPVISKRFNPELFGRYWLSTSTSKRGDYIDVIYGHESNGQSITTSTSYLDKRNNFIAAGENPDFANDFISRGWDYLAVTWRLKRRNPFSDKSFLTAYLGLRYYLSDGLLQGTQEEYNTWENDPEGKPRKSVDGIRLKVKYKTHFINNSVIKSNKIFLSYTTGYENIFEYNTYRAEWAVEIKNVPFMIWAAKGYNSDLADYYRDVTSAGISFEFLTN